MVFSCSKREHEDFVDRIHWLRRESIPRFISTRADTINWYASAGAAAIHLAILMGAAVIVLLGFDGKRGQKDEANWHPNLKNPEYPDNRITRHREGFELLAKHLSEYRGRTKVLNAGPDSELDMFQKVDLGDIL